MRFWPILAFAISCASAAAQVSVNEPATRAHLLDNQTAISLAFHNKSTDPLDAQITLHLLGPDDHESTSKYVAAKLAPGRPAIDIPFPLRSTADPLTARVRYDVLPSPNNLTAFGLFHGMLNLSTIADYAFALSALIAEPPQPDRPYQLRVLTLHPETGKPVPGVLVQARDTQAKSDSQGLALLTLNFPEGDDPKPVHLFADLGDYRQSQIVELPELRKPVVCIYTDKALYQPGQTVHFRTLAMKGSGVADANSSYTARVLDTNQALVYTVDLTTSRFGISSADWTTPSNLKSGDYRIEIQAGDDEPAAQKTIAVRRYDLPSFRVTAKTDRPYYLPDQTARLEVHADYLFGKPVANGSVRVTEGDDAKSVAEGKLSTDGVFTAALATGNEMPSGLRYSDRQFTAFVTDSSTAKRSSESSTCAFPKTPCTCTHQS